MTSDTRDSCFHRVTVSIYHLFTSTINISHFNSTILANFVVTIFDTSIVSFGDTFDVANVSAIGIYIATRFHVVNLLTTHINIVLSDSRTTSDSQTIVVNYCITNCYGAIWS